VANFFSGAGAALAFALCNEYRCNLFGCCCNYLRGTSATIFFTGGILVQSLKTVAPGQSVRVVRIDGQHSRKHRIMDMGITKGTELFVRKVAPLGDPFEICVRGYELSLRKADADLIKVELLEEKKP